MQISISLKMKKEKESRYQAGAKSESSFIHNVEEQKSVLQLSDSRSPRIPKWCSQPLHPSIPRLHSLSKLYLKTYSFSCKAKYK